DDKFITTDYLQQCLIFHSDQGTQYCSLPYRILAAQYGMMLSMSRSGNCWDNALQNDCSAV
ncbi:TPA: DDE-type integrase/transposase/recombinase, partial [Escherichia coli]|nr:DDE-type integrase/transposase/recombinase [Escherichia coli]